MNASKERQPAVVTATVLVGILAALAVTSSLVGLVASDGPGRHTVTTARGAAAILYGEGLYGADTWLIGIGNRGQDAAILLVEVPILLLARAIARGLESRRRWRSSK